MSTDQQIALVRLLLQFTVAMALLALAWWLFGQDQGEAGSLALGAVIAAWVNEGIHTGRQVSKLNQQPPSQEGNP